MGKMIVLRSICRAAAAASLRSSRFAASSHQLLQHRFVGSRSFFTISPASKCFSPECRSPLVIGLGSMRHFSEDVTHLPVIEDPEVKNAFKDLMAASWDKLPHSVVQDAKKALSKNSGDKAGQEALANVIRAAEAVEEFSGILTSLKMEIDDSIGLSGENVKPLPDKLSKALSTAYERYVTYLGAFGPEEGYLRKKVEMELGTKMIHLKMRCSGLGSEWGKVTVLGTSGLSGSYVEHRA